MGSWNGRRKRSWFNIIGIYRNQMISVDLWSWQSYYRRCIVILQDSRQMETKESFRIF